MIEQQARRGIVLCIAYPLKHIRALGFTVDRRPDSVVVVDEDDGHLVRCPIRINSCEPRDWPGVQVMNDF